MCNYFFREVEPFKVFTHLKNVINLTTNAPILNVFDSFLKRLIFFFGSSLKQTKKRIFTFFKKNNIFENVEKGYGFGNEG